MASFQQILNTRVVRKAISRYAATTEAILNFFGMQPGGPAEVAVGHRQATYDVFNDTRQHSIARAPGASAGTARRQAVGSVNVVFARFNERLPLLAEEVHNIRRIGGPTNEFDSAGVSYIKKQQRYLGQRVANARKVCVAGMLRGNLYQHKNGDDLYYDFTNALVSATINYQLPAANTSAGTLTGYTNPVSNNTTIIDTSWKASQANIPQHLAVFDKASQQTVGSRVDYGMCQGTFWQNIINNDYVVSQAGVANPPFRVFERQLGTGSNGQPLTMKTGILACAPFITFIITDEGLDLGTQASPTYTQFIGANDLWLGPAPTTDLFEGWLGDEPISDGPNMPWVVRMGLHAHVTETFNPTGVDLFTYDNFMAINYVPAASYYLTPAF